MAKKLVLVTSDNIHKKLVELSKQQGRTMAELIREGIVMLLDKYGRGSNNGNKNRTDSYQ